MAIFGGLRHPQRGFFDVSGRDLPGAVIVDALGLRRPRRDASDFADGNLSGAHVSGRDFMAPDVLASGFMTFEPPALEPQPDLAGGGQDAPGMFGQDADDAVRRLSAGLGEGLDEARRHVGRGGRLGSGFDRVGEEAVSDEGRWRSRLPGNRIRVAACYRPVPM